MLITRWTENCKTQEEKEQFEIYLRNSTQIFDRLKEIIEEENKQIARSETGQKQYDEPNWKYRQAHKNGYCHCLSMFRKLANLDLQEQK